MTTRNLLGIAADDEDATCIEQAVVMMLMVRARPWKKFMNFWHLEAK
jgi:hypothetical protein